MTATWPRHNERIERLLEGIQLEPISHAHIADAARLHHKLLSWSFNGKFGEAHIADLYTALMRSPHFFGYVYYRNGRLIGFVTGTTDYKDTRRHILQAYRGKLLKMLSIFIRYPAFLVAAMESKFVVPLVFERYRTCAEWLTLITDTSSDPIGPLVAVRLINAVREHFRSCGVGSYMAQGFKKNPRAMKMYEKLEWQVAANLPIHNVYHYVTGCGESDGRRVS